MKICEEKEFYLVHCQGAENPEKMLVFFFLFKVYLFLDFAINLSSNHIIH